VTEQQLACRASRGSSLIGTNIRSDMRKLDQLVSWRTMKVCLITAALAVSALAISSAATAATGRTTTSHALSIPVQSAPEVLPATIPFAYVYLTQNGYTDAFYVSGGQVYYWAYTNAGWSPSPFELSSSSPTVEPGTAIAANEQPNDNIAVYYIGTGGQLGNWLYDASQSEWSNGDVGEGEAAAAGSDISVIQHGDAQTVFYIGADNQVWTWSFDGSWSNTELRGEAAVSADGLTSDLQSNGDQQVFYVGRGGQIYSWINNTNQWLNSSIGVGEKAVDGSQLANLLLADGDLDVFYVGANHQVYAWTYTESWANSELGEGGTVAAGSGLAADNQPDGDLAVYYSGPGAKMYNWLFTTSWNNAPIHAKGGTPISAGSAIAVEDQNQSDFNVYYMNNDAVYSWLFDGINWRDTTI
jgi:hypothetical protein